MKTSEAAAAAGKPYPSGVTCADAGGATAGEAGDMALDTATAPQHEAVSADRPAVLRVAGVEKSFHRGIWPRRRTIPVLKGASLEVGAGELVGLVGENGSGKSTLMQIVVGLLSRDAGEVDRPARLGYCPQNPMLWDKLTVDEHFDLFARAYELAEDEASRSVDALVGELDFAKYRGYRIEELSGGTRQKLNLALSLMHDPQLLLLDEPYAGFDWETYLRFWEMSERRRDGGMGILIVSHLLAERERLDRMYEIRDGRVCGC
jgi:ABC-2 type transport system ATP-binding protein